MTQWKPALGLTLILACTAIILWSLNTYIISDPDYPCGQDALIYANHVREVFRENKQLFLRQPGYRRSMEHFFRDLDGNWSDEYGIVLELGEEFDRETQPPENRIPDEIDGVPVFLVVGTSNYSSARGHVVQEEIPEIHYAHSVLLKHEDLLMRQPNRASIPVRGILGEGGRPGEPLSVVIRMLVTEKVDQNTPAPADRIPDCLEGIPVIITEINGN